MMTDGTQSEDDADDTVEVECSRCGYTWDYSGEAWKATCPSCGYKVKTPYHEDYEHDSDE